MSADTLIIEDLDSLKTSPSTFSKGKLLESVEGTEFSTVFAVSSMIGLVKFISADSGDWRVVLVETETRSFS